MITGTYIKRIIKIVRVKFFPSHMYPQVGMH